jgi:hypothetical protein
MLATAFDATEALRVTRISSPDDRADLQGLSRLLVEFDAQTLAAPNKPVHLVLAETSIEANATDRKDFATVARNLRAPHLVFALVSPSIVHRGALQAVTWLTPPPPGHRVSSFTNLDSAMSWIRLEVGVPLLQLEPLLRRVGYAGTP